MTGGIYPHNFNLAYFWTAQTSALMRDWLLLTVRNGLDTDDQKSLHLAELRQRFVTRFSHPAAGLRVGRIIPEYGAAFQNVINASSHVWRRDRARVTPVLVGRVHVLHATNRSLCSAFNSDARGREYRSEYSDAGAVRSQRQMVLTQTDDLARAAGTHHSAPSLWYRPVLSQDDCVRTFGAKDSARACLLDDASQIKHSAVGEYVVNAIVEDYLTYASSSRCGAACTESMSLLEHNT